MQVRQSGKVKHMKKASSFPALGAGTGVAVRMQKFPLSGQDATLFSDI